MIHENQTIVLYVILVIDKGHFFIYLRIGLKNRYGN
jgi:hypothetical protein